MATRSIYDARKWVQKVSRDNSFGYTWNDVVVVNASAPEQFRPGSKGWVVGITDIKTKLLSDKYSEPIGSKVYTVEYEDGSSIEVNPRYLTKLDV